MDTTPTNPDALTSQQFQDAFKRIQSQLTDKQMAMLRKHHHAPERKITAGQLAEAVDYPNFTTANLQYGKIGSLLCELLGQEAGSEKLFVLVNFIPPHSESNDEWLWQMREPAAQALEQLSP